MKLLREGKLDYADPRDRAGSSKDAAQSNESLRRSNDFFMLRAQGLRTPLLPRCQLEGTSMYDRATHAHVQVGMRIAKHAL